MVRRFKKQAPKEERYPDESLKDIINYPIELDEALRKERGIPIFFHEFEKWEQLKILTTTLKVVYKSSLPIHITSLPDLLRSHQKKELQEIAVNITFQRLRNQVGDQRLDPSASGNMVFAILQSPFAQTLALEMDSRLSDSPEMLFQKKGYRDTGIYFHKEYSENLETHDSRTKQMQASWAEKIKGLKSTALQGISLKIKTAPKERPRETNQDSNIRGKHGERRVIQRLKAGILSATEDLLRTFIGAAWSEDISEGCLQNQRMILINQEVPGVRAALLLAAWMQISKIRQLNSFEFNCGGGYWLAFHLIGQPFMT